jgi:hypothetical protein
MISLRSLSYTGEMSRMNVGFGPERSSLVFEVTRSRHVVAASLLRETDNQGERRDRANPQKNDGRGHAADFRAGFVAANSSRVAMPLSASVAQQSAGIEDRCRQDQTVLTDLPVAAAISSTRPGSMMSA